MHFWNKEVNEEINKIYLTLRKENINMSNMLKSIIALIEQVIYEMHFDMVTFLDVIDLAKI